MLYPPADMKQLARKPLEMVFVLDSSGSMNGRPISEAKQAMERALRQLGPDDTFQLMNFDDRTSQLGATPVAATPENVRRGIDYLSKIEGGGGTMMNAGIGSSVNRYLLEHMAKAGRGAVAYLGPNDSAARIMDDFIARIRHPALTDLQVIPA